MKQQYFLSFKNKAGVYKITNPIGQVYIGSSANLYIRLASHYYSNKRKPDSLLNQSVLKYGAKNHDIEVLHVCPIRQLDELEEYYVKFYDSFNTAHGLNLQSGGSFSFQTGNYTKQETKIVSEVSQVIVPTVKIKRTKPKEVKIIHPICRDAFWFKNRQYETRRQRDSPPVLRKEW